MSTASAFSFRPFDEFIAGIGANEWRANGADYSYTVVCGVWGWDVLRSRYGTGTVEVLGRFPTAAEAMELASSVEVLLDGLMVA